MTVEIINKSGQSYIQPAQAAIAHLPPLSTSAYKFLHQRVRWMHNIAISNNTIITMGKTFENASRLYF